VAAPIFNRIAQQVLEYLDVPHDIEVRNPQRMLLRAKAKPEEEMEGSPDHVGEEVADNDNQQDEGATVAFATPSYGVIPAAYSSATTVAMQPSATNDADSSRADASPAALPKTGTVVLDVDSTRTVPSFVGKPVRTVIEESEKAGLEVDIFGSGVARQQNPPPGARLPIGGHVTVQFAR